MKRTVVFWMMLAVMVAGCSQPMTKTQKGALIGTGAGAAAGALAGQAIGHDTKGTLIGAGVGAVVGGLAGGFIGNYLDKQEAALRENMANVEGASVQRNPDSVAVTFKSDVLFDVGSSTLKGGSYDEIARVAKVVTQYPETTVLVAGHTDSTGSSESNQTLSERRAEAVKKALVGEGVNAARVNTVGYGEAKPVASNETESGRQQNRRVTITLKPIQQ